MMENNKKALIRGEKLKKKLLLCLRKGYMKHSSPGMNTSVCFRLYNTYETRNVRIGEKTDVLKP